MTTVPRRYLSLPHTGTVSNRCYLHSFLETLSCLKLLVKIMHHGYTSIRCPAGVFSISACWLVAMWKSSWWRWCPRALWLFSRCARYPRRVFSTQTGDALLSKASPDDCGSPKVSEASSAGHDVHQDSRMTTCSSKPSSNDHGVHSLPETSADGRKVFIITKSSVWLSSDASSNGHSA
jgi:hypothetical protein